ncbi:MAG: AAA family ATPase [Candidatus Puniceispirillum sp.]|nr:AAA family ATPase [Candidatus Puniceispirillum sp.]
MSGTGSLFSGGAKGAPLAERLRPKTLDEVVGQGHLFAQGSLLQSALETGHVPNLILWGPPGCGKTTLARLIAEKSASFFVSVSAIFTGTADLKKIFEEAQARLRVGQKTLLFVDEIHRFNRAQQDTFLAHLEDGRLTLVGATTENPSFELNGALLSRSHVLTLKRLEAVDLDVLAKRCEEAWGLTLTFEEDARALLFQMADGDGRALIHMMEALLRAHHKQDAPLTQETLLARLPKRASLYDKGRDGHYSLISALHKSIRGSDVNAALYWFARMLEGGEDPLYLGRRLLRMASEDIGLADPNALSQAVAAVDVFERLGSPEGELALAQVVIYLATAPKSNAAYVAYGRARDLAKRAGSLPPPAFAVNAPTRLMQTQGYGEGYLYDHDQEDAFSGQNYFPDALPRETLYDPKDYGFERELRKRLDFWHKKRQEKGGGA